MNKVISIFLKGLAALLPITITIYAIYWLAVSAEMAMKFLVPSEHYSPPMGVLTGLVIVFVVGLLLNAWIARRLFRLFEQLLEHIPMIKSLYGSVKDLLGFFMGSDRGAANQVVMVTLGEPGTPAAPRLLGLLTRDDFADLPDGVGDSDTVAVYLPMSYQLGGFTVMVPRSTVQPIAMTTEQALRFAVTAGMSATDTEPGQA